MFLNLHRKTESTPIVRNVDAEGSADERQQAECLYQYVKELALLKYEHELRREDSLIQQSSHMQTAFSFITGALFMLLPVMIEYRGPNLTVDFFLLSVSTIVFLLVGSLIAASFAQRRTEMKVFPDIWTMEKNVSDNYETLQDRASQLKQWVQIVADVQKSLSDANDKRVTNIRWSMGLFFATIGLSCFWFVIGVLKIRGII